MASVPLILDTVRSQLVLNAMFVELAIEDYHHTHRPVKTQHFQETAWAPLFGQSCLSETASASSTDIVSDEFQTNKGLVGVA